MIVLLFLTFVISSSIGSCKGKAEKENGKRLTRDITVRLFSKLRSPHLSGMVSPTSQFLKGTHEFSELVVHGHGQNGPAYGSEQLNSPAPFEHLKAIPKKSNVFETNLIL